MSVLEKNWTENQSQISTNKEKLKERAEKERFVCCELKYFWLGMGFNYQSAFEESMRYTPHCLLSSGAMEAIRATHWFLQNKHWLCEECTKIEHRFPIHNIIDLPRGWHPNWSLKNNL